MLDSNGTVYGECCARLQSFRDCFRPREDLNKKYNSVEVDFAFGEGRQVTAPCSNDLEITRDGSVP